MLRTPDFIVNTTLYHGVMTFDIFLLSLVVFLGFSSDGPIDENVGVFFLFLISYVKQFCPCFNRNKKAWDYDQSYYYIAGLRD